MVVASATRATSTNTGTRAAQQGSGYTVRRGDNLTHIAKRHGVNLRDVIKANPQIKDPNKIFPGQSINLPSRRGSGVTATPTTTGPRHTTLSSGAGPRPVAGGLDPRTLETRFNSQNGMLRRGANGQQVTDLQSQLKALGHNPGPADGVFGQRTHDALRSFQRSQNLSADGVLGPKTQAALQNPVQPQPIQPGTSTSAPNLQVYPPNSPEAVALFRDAAKLAGVPESWASSPGLHNILRRESNGKVGVPNYTYGARARDPSRWGEVHNELKNGRKTARSSATGLGQLLLSNVDAYYPNGRQGIGNPVQEAAGMLNYIKARYGSPERAWALYGTRHEGY